MMDFDAARRLIDYYVKAVKVKTGREPDVNRNKAKFPMIGIMEDYSEQQVQRMIACYVKTTIRPDLIDFVYNYTDVVEQLERETLDRQAREKIMKQTAKSVQEYKERYG